MNPLGKVSQVQLFSGDLTGVSGSPSWVEWGESCSEESQNTGANLGL